MRDNNGIGHLDPVDHSRVDEAVCGPAFDELRDAVVAVPRYPGEPGDGPLVHVGGAGRPRRRAVVAVAAVAVLLVVVGVVAVGGGAGHPGGGRVVAVPGPSASVTHLHRGTWQTLDASVRGLWRQNTSGPPSGTLSCPTATTCYQMAGHFPSAMAGAPLLYESLSVSTDAGRTWTEYRVPSGFAPTSPISCGGPTSCAAGGNLDGRAVLLATDDGGRSFTTSPLPPDVGAFVALDCTAVHVCSGLAASRLYVAGHADATFLATSDGGSTFTDHPIVPGDSMVALSCASRLACTTVGTDDALGVADWTSGVVARTTDGGRTWTRGILPGGFGISQYSQLSCADTDHCAVIGDISVRVANPPECAGTNLPGGVTTTTRPEDAPDQAVQAIEGTESRIASAANVSSGGSGGGFSCGPGPATATLINDVASTTDGGETWTPDALPDGVPQPILSGISCPTADECWTSGEAAIPQRIGTSTNGGSSILLGSTDGGRSWSPVRFSVPDGAPNVDGQSYLSLGFITCPVAGACFANGSTAQGSPTAPFYALTQRPRGV